MSTLLLWPAGVGVRTRDASSLVLHVTYGKVTREVWVWVLLKIPENWARF